MGLWCRPHDHLLEEISGQTIKILTTSDKIDLSNEETTGLITIIDTMTTERDHNISETKTNPRIGKVTLTILDRLQRHDRIHLPRIFADNPDQTRLNPQCLIGLGIETPATIYLMTRNSQHPTTVTSQTWFDSLQQTMKLMDYWDNAL